MDKKLRENRILAAAFYEATSKMDATPADAYETEDESSDSDDSSEASSRDSDVSSDDAVSIGDDHSSLDGSTR